MISVRLNMGSSRHLNEGLRLLPRTGLDHRCEVSVGEESGKAQT